MPKQGKQGTREEKGAPGCFHICLAFQAKEKPSASSSLGSIF